MPAIPCKDELVSSQEYESLPHHTLGGNRVRFARGTVQVRTDDEWKRAMPQWRQALVVLLRCLFSSPTDMWDAQGRTDGGEAVFDMRALIISLSTYSAPFNDGKLAELGHRIEDVTAVAGDVPTLWGSENSSRLGEGYRVHVLETRFQRSNATTMLRGLGRVSQVATPT